MRVFVDAPSRCEGGVCIGSLKFDPSQPGDKTVATIDVSQLSQFDGKHALYFSFASRQKNQSICELHEFKFKAE